jgi:hypothetical protein
MKAFRIIMSVIFGAGMIGALRLTEYNMIFDNIPMLILYFVLMFIGWFGIIASTSDGTGRHERGGN